MEPVSPTPLDTYTTPKSYRDDSIATLAKPVPYAEVDEDAPSGKDTVEANVKPIRNVNEELEKEDKSSAEEIIVASGPSLSSQEPSLANERGAVSSPEGAESLDVLSDVSTTDDTKEIEKQENVPPVEEDLNPEGRQNGDVQTLEEGEIIEGEDYDDDDLDLSDDDEDGISEKKKKGKITYARDFLMAIGSKVPAGAFKIPEQCADVMKDAGGNNHMRSSHVSN